MSFFSVIAKRKSASSMSGDLSGSIPIVSAESSSLQQEVEGSDISGRTAWKMWRRPRMLPSWSMRRHTTVTQTLSTQLPDVSSVAESVQKSFTVNENTEDFDAVMTMEMPIETRGHSKSASAGSKSRSFGQRSKVSFTTSTSMDSSWTPEKSTSTSTDLPGMMPEGLMVTTRPLPEGQEFRTYFGLREARRIASEQGWVVVESRKEESHHGSLGFQDYSIPEECTTVLVVHQRGYDAITRDHVMALRQEYDTAISIFVLLIGDLDSDDCDNVIALQSSLLSLGADDIICNPKDATEFKMTVRMCSTRRWRKFEDETQQRQKQQAEFKAILQERVHQAQEEELANGMFWDVADRVFQGFPKLDNRLELEPAPGKMLAANRLTGELGSGSFGRVFASVNVETGEKEAVKTVFKGKLPSFMEARAIWEEMKNHSKLQHKSIVAFHGVLHSRSHLIFIMEAVESPNLFKVLRSQGGSLPMAHVRTLHRQLASAIAYCHSQHVAHRDLKPENLTVNLHTVQLKVLDFGHSVDTRTARTDIAGTLPFMAPEVFIAEDQPYDPAPVDIWAMSVVLLEMLYGVHKFSRMLGWKTKGCLEVGPERRDELERYFADDRTLPLSLSEDGVEVDDALIKLLRGTLQLDPKARLTAEGVLSSVWLKSRCRQPDGIKSLPPAARR